MSRLLSNTGPIVKQEHRVLQMAFARSTVDCRGEPLLERRRRGSNNTLGRFVCVYECVWVYTVSAVLKDRTHVYIFRLKHCRPHLVYFAEQHRYSIMSMSGL